MEGNLEQQLEELGFRFRKPAQCGYCERIFTPRHSNQRFCSKECCNEARVVYKGLRLKWADLREFVLERDNYTCQDCGKQLADNELEVHHVVPLYSRGTNKETNLVALCHKCHKGRHSL